MRLPVEIVFELEGDGIFHDHDTRYALDRRVFGHLRRLIEGDEVTFAGQYIHIERGRLLFDGDSRAQARDLLWGFIGSRASYSRVAR